MGGVTFPESTGLYLFAYLSGVHASNLCLDVQDAGFWKLMDHLEQRASLALLFPVNGTLGGVSSLSLWVPFLM